MKRRPKAARAGTLTRIRHAAVVAVAATGLIAAGTVNASASNMRINFANQRWSCGTSVASTRVQLIFQCDGNLVLYQISGHRALWATGTSGWGVKSVQWAQSGNGDDNIFLEDSNGDALCWIPGYKATVVNGYAWVTDSGSLVLYSGNGTSDWATDTDNGAQGSTNLCDGWDYNLT